MVNSTIKQSNQLKFLQDLVAFPSVTPEDAGSLDYIANFITMLGGSTLRVDRNKTCNLIATLGCGDKIFAFAGHVDVVPTGDFNLWRNKDPFTVFQDGDDLIGRGVADMKGAIAAFMSALARFVLSVNNSEYKIMLLLTSDEEGDATDGTIVMVDYLQKNKISLDYCLVGEPSCVDKLGDTIKVGRRGSLTGDLTIHGKQGHIAYPHLCQNPIHDFAPALVELSGYVWDGGNQFFPPSSLQFANLNSGLGVTNVIPGVLKCNFNFRYNTEHTVDELKNSVIAILDKHKLKYDLIWKHSAKPFMTEVGDFIPLVHDAIYQATGMRPQNKTDGGTSDGRFLIDVSKQIIEFGLRNASIHQINESTTLSDLNQLTDTYYYLLQNIFDNNNDDTI